MAEGSTAARQRKRHDTGHASLCVLGPHLRRTGLFRPLEEGLKLEQKVLKYPPVQQWEMLFVALLAGAKALSQTSATLRVDAALQAACGLPGCADQSVIADTLCVQYSQACRHACDQAVLGLDLDLSPLPASPRAEGSERGYRGRSRSKTGRQSVRVRAAQYGETGWEAVLPGRTGETLAVLQQAGEATERLLGLDGDTPEAQARRTRTEWRLDSAWGSEEDFDWLLGRGYQVTAKCRSTARVEELVAPIADWQPTSSAGREVALVPCPVASVRPTHQHAVRTPTDAQPGGFQHAIVCSSRLERDMQPVVAHYDARAGMEADLKGDKGGLGWATLRKLRLAAQQVLVFLVALAHNVLVWSRRWRAAQAPRSASFGTVRLVRAVWAVPGRVKRTQAALQRVRLKRAHPWARQVSRGLRLLLAPSETLELWP